MAIFQMNFSLLVAVVAVLSLANGIQSVVISVTNGESSLGSNWGPLESCPTGSRVTSYQTQNEVNVPSVVDDAALHTIVLFCNDPAGTNITSTQGFAGNWQDVQSCPFDGFPVGFQLRVSPAGNTTDNTAVNNIRFWCSNNREINSVGNTGGYWGNYSDKCPNGICGIETRVRSDGGVPIDDTAMNDVRFTCCSATDLLGHADSQ